MLFADFGRLDPPKVGFQRPPLVAARRDSAPVRGATAQTGDDPGLEMRVDLGIGIWGGVDRQQFGLDQHGAYAGQQGIVDPTACAVPILNLAPVAVFGGDLQGHAAAFEDPVDSMGQGWAAADIALGRFHRDVTRQRQVRHRPARVLRGGRQRSTGDHKRQQQRQNLAFHRKNSTHCLPALMPVDRVSKKG